MAGRGGDDRGGGRGLCERGGLWRWRLWRRRCGWSSGGRRGRGLPSCCRCRCFFGIRSRSCRGSRRCCDRRRRSRRRGAALFRKRRGGGGGSGGGASPRPRRRSGCGGRDIARSEPRHGVRSWRERARPGALFGLGRRRLVLGVVVVGGGCCSPGRLGGAPPCRRGRRRRRRRRRRRLAYIAAVAAGSLLFLRGGVYVRLFLHSGTFSVASAPGTRKGRGRGVSVGEGRGWLRLRRGSRSGTSIAGGVAAASSDIVAASPPRRCGPCRVVPRRRGPDLGLAVVTWRWSDLARLSLRRHLSRKKRGCRRRTNGKNSSIGEEKSSPFLFFLFFFQSFSLCCLVRGGARGEHGACARERERVRERKRARLFRAKKQRKAERVCPFRRKK